MLDDHKRKGKIFKPPLLAFGTFIEAGWFDYSIPELIWILLLIQEYGAHEGSRLSVMFSNITDPYINPKANNPSAASIISFYNILSHSDKSYILKEMERYSILQQFQKTFTLFIALYPKCPFSFIVEGNEQIEKKLKDEYLLSYKKNLEKFFYKKGFESSIVLANVMGFLASLDRIKITEKSMIPDLNEIFNYPNTDASIHLASFLGSTVAMCFNAQNYDRNNSWINYFWNQSIKIESCRI